MGKRKRTENPEIVVVVVTERRGFLKVLVTLLGAVVSGVAGRLVDQFLARPVPTAPVLTPAPLVVTPNTVVAAPLSVVWESVGRASVCFEGVAITPGTGELRIGA